MVIVLDAGHGGADRGAIGNGITEAAYVLALQDEVASALAIVGLEAHLIRADDTDPPFAERADRAHALGATLAISLHCNANVNQAVHGLEVYHLLHADARTRALAVGIMRRAPAALWRPAWVPVVAQPNPSDPKTAYLARARNVMARYDCPVVLVELGFLSNEGDALALNAVDVRRGLCLAIAGACLDFAR